jgi:hypothetical protein
MGAYVCVPPHNSIQVFQTSGLCEALRRMWNCERRWHRHKEPGISPGLTPALPRNGATGTDLLPPTERLSVLQHPTNWFRGRDITRRSTCRSGASGLQLVQRRVLRPCGDLTIYPARRDRDLPRSRATAFSLLAKSSWPNSSLTLSRQPMSSSARVMSAARGSSRYVLPPATLVDAALLRFLPPRNEPSALLARSDKIKSSSY